MHKYILAIISLALTGCGAGTLGGPEAAPAAHPPRPVVVGHVTLQAHLDQFLNLCKRYGKTCNTDNLKIEFVDNFVTRPNTAGMCTIWWEGNNFYRVVQVRKDDIGWGPWSEYAFAGLMAHEFGHCILYQKHAPDGALSIMAPNMLSEDEYRNNWNALIKDLFTVDRSKKE